MWQSALWLGGVVPMNGLTEAIAAAEIVACLPAASPDAPLLPGRDRLGETLSEPEAKARLAALGLRVPKQCNSIEDAQALTAPFAVKGVGFAHKSEAGRCRVKRAPFRAFECDYKRFPGEAFLIEEMVHGHTCRDVGRRGS